MASRQSGLGAATMAVHGDNRSTRDLDVLVAGTECLAPAYWEPLRAGGAIADIRRGDERDPLAGVVRLRPGEEPPLDVVVGKDAWPAEILRRAQETDLEGGSLPVVRRADLTLLKLHAGGPQDAWDIEQRLAVPDRTALGQEVEGRLDALPEESRRLWARLASGWARPSAPSHELHPRTVSPWRGQRRVAHHERGAERLGMCHT